MYKTFYYAVGDSWIVGMYGTRVVYTITKAEYRARDGKEIYTVDVDGNNQVMTKNRLHYILHMAIFKKLKSGKPTRYKLPEPPKSIVQAYYAEIRYAEDKRLERIQAKLDASDLYQNIKAEISVYSREHAKAEFFKADILKLKDLKNKLNAAQIERIAILKSLKIKPEDLKRKVHCAKCGDYGYVNNVPCECQKVHMPKIIDKWDKERGKTAVAI